MAILRTVIQDTHQKLEGVGIPDARLEAEVLVMNVMHMARQSIFAEQETEVSAQQQSALDAFVERRFTREPLAYILGQREFYGINVVLTPSVLIHDAASFMAVAIAVPRMIAAPAMPAPTMARINAYSAADAPLSSFQSCLMNVISRELPS